MKPAQAPPDGPLDLLVQKLLKEARAQKIRVQERQRALRGDWIGHPSRGPRLGNGLLCLRWHFWRASQKKLAHLTSQITALISVQKLLKP